MTRAPAILAIAFLLAAGLRAGDELPASWQEAWRAGESRVSALEQRVAALERLIEPHGDAVDPLAAATERVYAERFVELYEVEARYVEDMLSGRVAAVFGKIRNRGPRTLRKVRITAAFFDAEGNPIHEDDYESIVADAPLKPKYVRKFGFKAERCPSEWAEGRVEVAVTAVVFAE